VEAVTSAGIGLWALVALAQTGPAVSVPVRVEFDAPPGCSDAEAFFAGVLARTRHVHRARPGETAVRLAVRVARSGGRVRGELRVNEAGAEAETRRVDGASCAEVVQVLSLTAALAIDPSASLLGPAAPEKPAATSSVRPPGASGATPAPGRAGPGAAATSPPARAGAGAATTPMPAPVTTPPASASASSASSASSAAPAAQLPSPAAGARPERPPEAGAASTPPAAPTAGRESARAAALVAEPREQPARPTGPRFGASVVAARVLTSSLALGGSFWGRLGLATRGGLTPSVTLAALYLPADFFESGDDLGIGWLALVATACPGWAPGGRVRVEPCARLTAGVLSATDHSVNSPRSVDRWWGSAGALVRLTAMLGGGLMLDVDAGVDFPFVTRRFTTTTNVTNQPVGATTSISPTLLVGLSHSL
jgi:hypothetical protein